MIHCIIIIHSDTYLDAKIYLSGEHKDPIIIYDNKLEIETKYYGLPHMRSEIICYNETKLYTPHYRLLDLNVMTDEDMFLIHVTNTDFIIKGNFYNYIDLEKKTIVYSRKNTIPLYRNKLLPIFNDFKEEHMFNWKKDIDLHSVVFAGGSMYTLAMLGAVTKLRSLLEKANLWCCTSGGAILGILLIIGLSNEDIKKTIYEINFGNYVDDQSNVYLMMYNLIKDYSLSNGQYLIEKKIREMVKNKIGIDTITFRELYLKYNKILVMTTVNISVSSTWYLSFVTTPDLDIVKAAMMSSALPFIWPPQEYQNHLFIDGGICNNFPIDQTYCYEKYMKAANHLKLYPNATKQELNNIFDQNKINLNYIKTLDEHIVAICTQKMISTSKTKVDLCSSLFEYGKAIGNVIANEPASHPNLTKNICKIPIYSNIDNTFQMKKNEINELIEEGEYYSHHFLNSFIQSISKL